MNDTGDLFVGREVLWLEDATNEDYSPDEIVMRAIRVHFKDGGTATIVAEYHDGPMLAVDDSVVPASTRKRP